MNRIELIDKAWQAMILTAEIRNELHNDERLGDTSVLAAMHKADEANQRLNALMQALDPEWDEVLDTDDVPGSRVRWITRQPGGPWAATTSRG